MAKHIKILHGDTSTGRLILDKPNLEADTHNKIKWKINSGSGVDSIVDIQDKAGSMDVWITRPKGYNTWEGKIKSKRDIPTPYEYKYSIVWGKDGETYTHDPKITINPALIELPDDDGEPLFEEKWLVPLALSVLAVTAVALIFLRKKKNKKNWL